MPLPKSGENVMMGLGRKARLNGCSAPQYLCYRYFHAKAHSLVRVVLRSKKGYRFSHGFDVSMFMYNKLTHIQTHVLFPALKG